VLLEADLQAAVRAQAPYGFVFLEAPILWGQAQLDPMGLTL
jgi:hypothetical protein